ncbi:MAG: SDR family NAD(P)-dependent oxidoreductase [Anaerolineales bacterium]
MQDFEKRVVMITGAAGSLGGAAAASFQQRKAHLVLVDRVQDRLEKIFPELVGNQAHILAGGYDLTVEEDVRSLVQRTLDQFRKVDVLLNIAGMYRGSTPVVDTDLDLWQTVMAVNARSVLLTSQAVAPSMIEQGYGKIINIGARPAFKAGSGNAAYAASKSAVLRLTESLSSELKAHGINVNAIIPGTIDTQANREMMPDADHDKWVDPEALVEVLLFLASDSARAVHAAALPVLGLT